MLLLLMLVCQPVGWRVIMAAAVATAAAAPAIAMAGPRRCHKGAVGTRRLWASPALAPSRACGLTHSSVRQRSS